MFKHITIALALAVFVLISPLPRVFAHEKSHGLHANRLTDTKTFANNPAVAASAEGEMWVTWIQHHTDKGDEVVIARRDGSDAFVVSRGLGQYLRPVLAVAGDRLMCVWTQTDHDHVSTIWTASRPRDDWSEPRRLVPYEARAHQNPEIAAGADGQFAVVYQVHNGRNYDIFLFDGQTATRISDSSVNDWDPTVTFDKNGKVHVAWSGFRDGDYDIYWKPGDAVPRRISARGQYDMHPWLASAPDGRVWISWDAVKLPGHANSGTTTIIGANPGHKIPSMYGKGQHSWIEARVLDGEEVLLPGNPRQQIVPPKEYETSHTALPKIAISRSGQPWIVYRALHKQKGSWLPSGGTLYYWDLVARRFQDGAWGEAVRLGDSDGYLEEASLVGRGSGVVAVYGGEQRLGSPERLKKHRKDRPQPDPHNHHSDYFGKVGCNGEVFRATLRDVDEFVLGDLPVAPPLNDRKMPKRERREQYSATVKGKKYNLYWGDTHRHSNVSRCSVGLEPTPDDLYRYGDDICNYDFFALSDHGAHFANTTEDSSNYYWWLNLKLADLYHVPDYMSVLYNYEWTMNFPHGHHNVIFPGRPTLRMDRVLEKSRNLERGWQTLRNANMKAITVPHTGADPEQGTSWEDHDEQYHRVVEIFQSARGSYEHDGCPRQFPNSGNKKGFYWKALEKGYRVGVIASSDHGYGVAYACVYAEENSREAIWKAMWDRRCYGTTTYGLVVDLRSGDHWMGEAWPSAEAPKLKVHVDAAAPIRSVEIIGRSTVLYAHGSIEHPLGTRSHDLEWTDPDWADQTAEQWYYVRVIQANDEIAWTSPVWVAPTSAEE